MNSIFDPLPSTAKGLPIGQDEVRGGWIIRTLVGWLAGGGKDDDVEARDDLVVTAAVMLGNLARSGMSSLSLKYPSEILPEAESDCAFPNPSPRSRRPLCDLGQGLRPGNCLGFEVGCTGGGSEGEEGRTRRDCEDLTCSVESVEKPVDSR